jgi:response regulator RpfG family c-di-GMP phosphodiesterase
MGGEIWVGSPSTISEKPEFPGTKFSFTLETYSNEKLNKEGNLTSVKQLNEIKAIIVSQVLHDTEPVFSFFEQVGISFEKHTYNTIESSQDTLSASDYHLIVIIDSLEFDGFKISQALHDNNLSSKYLIILISSNDLSGNFIRSRRVGIDYYLIKPYETSEIFEIIRQSFTSVDTKEKTPVKLKKMQKNILMMAIIYGMVECLFGKQTPY